MRRALSLVPLLFLALAIMFLPEMSAGGHNSVVRGWLLKAARADGPTGELTLAQILIVRRSASAKARESFWSTQTISAY